MPEIFNTYELTYLVNAVLSEEQAKSLAERYDTYITENGGKILGSNAWGSRRLAYPIAKKRNAFYFNVFFEAPGRVIQRLERALEIEDDVLRYLTIRHEAKSLKAYQASPEAMSRVHGDGELLSGRDD